MRNLITTTQPETRSRFHPAPLEVLIQRSVTPPRRFAGGRSLVPVGVWVADVFTIQVSRKITN